ncbi:MAG TPA: hypothetical protein VGI45_16540 [Terracidiphilus sp.]
MSEDAIAARSRALLRARKASFVFACIFLVIAAVLVIWSLGWIAILPRANEHFVIAAVSLLIVALTQFLLPKSRDRVTEAALAAVQVQSVSLNSKEVQVKNGPWSRTILINEIVRADEPRSGLGLFLRTSNPLRWLLIPRRIEGYEEIKSNLTANGISVAQTRFSPQRIEYGLFAVAFGTMICELVTSSRGFLLGNVALGIVIAVVGMQVALERADSAKIRFQYILFYSFPLIFAALGLWLRHP